MRTCSPVLEEAFALVTVLWLGFLQLTQHDEGSVCTAGPEEAHMDVPVSRASLSMIYHLEDLNSPQELSVIR